MELKRRKYKIRVPDEATSAAVQKHLFTLGARWAGGSNRNVSHTEGRFLYVDNGLITFGDGSIREGGYFIDDCGTEITVDELLSDQSTTWNERVWKDK